MLAVGLLQIAAYFCALSTPHGFALGCVDQNCYAQAARRIVDGHPFSYAPGEPVTTGQTSVAYPFVLAAPYALGCTGERLRYASFALNAFFYLVFLAAWAAVIVRILPASGYARFAAASLVSLSGCCAYVAFTQCDQGLWMAVSALIALALVAERRAALSVLLTVAPWVRPEGMMVVAAYGFFVLLNRRRQDVAPLLCGIVSTAGVFALNYALTGSVQFSSVSDKGYFRLFPFSVAVREFLGDAFSIAGAYLCALPLPKERFFTLPSPVTALCFWIGFIPLCRPAALKTRPVVFFLAASMCVGSVALGGFAGLDFDRYLAWLMPVILLTAAVGLDRLAGWIRNGFWRKLPIVALVMTTLFSTVSMALMMNYVAPVRAEMFGAIRSAAKALPSDAVVGSENFVWAYELPDGCRYRELTGIFSPDYRGATYFPNGLDLLKNRPDLRFEYWALAPVQSEQLSWHPYYRGAIYGTPFADGLGGEMLRRADWSAYDRAAEVPRCPTGMTCVARMDVGYVQEERAAQRRPLAKSVADSACVAVVAGRKTDGLPMVDSGAFVTSGESFALPVTPGKAATLVLRTTRLVHYETGDKGPCDYDYGSELSLSVDVEGQSTAGFHQQLVSNVFTDVSLEIPAAALSRSNACFTVRGRFVSCGYWLFQ